MIEKPGTDPTVPPEEQAAEPSTEVVVLARHRPVPARRWPDVVVRVRTRLVALREHPAAPVVASAAATVGSALLTAGLQRVLRGSALPVPGRPASVTLRGYVRHEVHIVQHVVHHVVVPPKP
jgi:hypothetical protein